MKIALAIENFSRFGGGAESYAVELADTLIKHDWEVHLFGYTWDGEPERAIFHKIRKLPRFLPPSIKILDFALQHRKLSQQIDFDVVLGFGNTIYMNVYQSHGGVHAYSNLRKLHAVSSPLLRTIKKIGMWLTPKYHMRAWIESSAFRRNPRPVIVAISDMIRDDFCNHFKIDPNEIVVIYNGINPNKFKVTSDAGVKSQFRFTNEVLFLFMAYDFRKKGVHYLVRAAGDLKKQVGANKFGLLIVGREPDTGLRKLLKELDLEGTVVFPGPTKTPEAFYAASDVFVLPTFYDACSLVVFEAMNCGLPVITTIFNGASGIIKHGENGIILQNPADTEEITLAMKKFLDKSFLKDAGDAARLTAEDYTIETNHKRMMEIFRIASNEKRLH